MLGIVANMLLATILYSRNIGSLLLIVSHLRRGFFYLTAEPESQEGNIVRRHASGCSGSAVTLDNKPKSRVVNFVFGVIAKPGNTHENNSRKGVDIEYFQDIEYCQG